MNDWYVIYCLLTQPDNVGHMISLIKRDFFSDELPLKVYDYVNELYTKNINPTVDLVKAKFPDSLEQMFLDCNIDSIQYPEYIESQRQVYVNREVRNFASMIVNSKADINSTKFSDYTTDLVSKISYSTNEEDIYYMDNVVDEVLERANQKEIVYDKVQWGIKPLDDLFYGHPGGTLVYIAGRPSMGKSGVIAELCRYNAMNGLVGVLSTLEMSAIDIVNRMLASASDVELWKLKRFRNRSVGEQNKIIEVAKKLKAMPLIIDGTAGLTVNKLKSTIQKTVLKYGRIDFIAIDYLQLMVGDDNLNDNARISKISRELKILSVQYNCPVIVGSQLSRGCESRDNKRPMLSDMRDSGAIEQDADIVIMCYRDEYYTGNPEHDKILELIIRKFRNGPVGKVIVEYSKQKQSLKEINPNSPLGKTAKQFTYL